MSNTKPTYGYFEMFKKFADENKLQDFTLKFMVEYNTAGAEKIQNFYATVTTATGRQFSTANNDFEKMLQSFETVVNQ